MKLAISPEGIAVIRALDLRAARRTWKLWLRALDDEGVLVVLHR